MAQLGALFTQIVCHTEDGVLLLLGIRHMIGCILVRYRKVREQALYRKSRLREDLLQLPVAGSHLDRLHADASHAGIQRDMAAHRTSGLCKAGKGFGIFAGNDRLDDLLFCKHGGTFRRCIAENEDLPLRAVAAHAHSLLKARHRIEPHAELIELPADDLLAVPVGIRLDDGAVFRGIGKLLPDLRDIVCQGIE